MAKHDALIVWRSDGQFSTGRYSRAHQWRFDGGAIVPASSSPHVVPVPMSDPAGVDPEEALVASASSCHMLWFLDLARRAGLTVESYRDDAVGEVGKDDRGRIALLTIRLRPAIVFAGKQPSAEELEQLHDKAHESCFIANSLRSDVVVEAAAE
ncbi:MAG TPA: OsmC family protein [Allosphingosinicella sp.]|nr:OsmC family protein [Allosphingosinicella sp.]